MKIIGKISDKEILVQIKLEELKDLIGFSNYYQKSKESTKVLEDYQVRDAAIGVSIDVTTAFKDAIEAVSNYESLKSGVDKLLKNAASLSVLMPDLEKNKKKGGN